MAIVTCDHNNGQMGMCRACSDEIEASERRMKEQSDRQNELLGAARVAEKHGLHRAAEDLRAAAEKRSG
jgi:hypothetical protein